MGQSRRTSRWRRLARRWCRCVRQQRISVAASEFTPTHRTTREAVDASMIVGSARSTVLRRGMIRTLASGCRGPHARRVRERAEIFVERFVFLHQHDDVLDAIDIASRPRAHRRLCAGSTWRRRAAAATARDQKRNRRDQRTAQESTRTSEFGCSPNHPILGLGPLILYYYPSVRRTSVIICLAQRMHVLSRNYGQAA